MSHTTHPRSIGQVSELVDGGSCAWRLPADPSCASAGRSLLHMALTGIGVTGDVADAAVLAASELATNSLRHGLRADPQGPVVAPELWVRIRTTPAPQLVVTVFDACRAAWPRSAPGDLLDEHGRGVGIVNVVADAWGAHLSRSRLGVRSEPGKAVWAAFTLPRSWRSDRTASPSAVARQLAAALAARGIASVDCRHDQGVSLVGLRLAAGKRLNVWVEPSRLSFADVDGNRVSRAIVDVHDVAEHLVRRAEELHSERNDRPS